MNGAIANVLVAILNKKMPNDNMSSTTYVVGCVLLLPSIIVIRTSHAPGEHSYDLQRY